MDKNNQISGPAKPSKFDKNRQETLLRALRDAHPDELDDEICRVLMDSFEDRKTLAANLVYLQEGGYIENSFMRTADGITHPALFNAKITEKGINYIEGDAALGNDARVQIIKIHNCTIQALEDVLALAKCPEEQKSDFLEKLRNLRGHAITHLTSQLLTQAVLHPEGALQLIQKFLHH
ncbi:YjcQ family protein [Klebsiella pneumoniae]|nr:YjcQ family protein [Klebsiella pneumoniae]